MEQQQTRLVGLRELMEGNMSTEYLIDGVLPVNVNAMLYADEAACKSFLLLDGGLPSQATAIHGRGRKSHMARWCTWLQRTRATNPSAYGDGCRRTANWK